MAIERSVGLQAPSAGEPGPSRRLVFGIVEVGLFMSSIDATIVATAMTDPSSANTETVALRSAAFGPLK